MELTRGRLGSSCNRLTARHSGASFEQTPDTDTNEIIQFLSQKLNLPEDVVRSAAGVLLNFIKQKATGSQFESFVGLLPRRE